MEHEHPEVTAAKERLAVAEADLKKHVAEKEQLEKRFTAAQKVIGHYPGYFHKDGSTNQINGVWERITTPGEPVHYILFDTDTFDAERPDHLTSVIISQPELVAELDRGLGFTARAN